MKKFLSLILALTLALSLMLVPGIALAQDTAIDAEVGGVTLVTPATGDINTAPTVVITGFGFLGALDVTFSGAGITVTDFTEISDTEITADLSIAADAPAGLRDVTVTITEGDLVGAGLFTVSESFTLTAPLGINLGMMIAGTTTTGSSVTDGTVVTNITVSWEVDAADLSTGGYMLNATPTALAALFEISDDGITYGTADIGITYTGDPTTLPFFVSQDVDAGDEVGSYAITITFTGSY